MVHCHGEAFRIDTKAQPQPTEEEAAVSGMGAANRFGCLLDGCTNCSSDCNGIDVAGMPPERVCSLDWMS